MQTPRLADSLTELAATIESRHGVRPNVSVGGPRPEQASPGVDMQLFRIAQEAVNNAIRHGRATHIDVTVAYGADRVALTIKDDGCGFTPAEEASWRHADEHFGLVTMRERAERAGGHLQIVSAPGAGTTVQTVAKVTSEWV